MAYVAISQALVSDVLITARNLTQKESYAVTRVDEPKLQGDEDWLIKMMWGEHLHLKAVIPPAWCRNRSEIRISLNIPDILAETPDARTKYSIDCDITKALVCPPPGADEYRSSREFLVNIEEHPEFAAVVEYKDTIREITTRGEKTKKQLNAFLDKCKSLNEALKIWPDLRLYVPKSYLDKVETKVERTVKEKRKPDDMLEGIDTEQLTANAVLARMAA